MKHLTLGLCLLLLSACSGPFLWLPGGELNGTEQPLDLTQLPEQASVLELETRPANPYSVNIGFRLIDGEMYIDPAAERNWYQHIVDNPQVRFRFSGESHIHPAIAEPVTDPQILSQFEADRIILRLRPR